MLDTNVLIDAMRDPAAPVRQLFTRIPPALRATSIIVLYEVAFARRGAANGTLEANQEWLADHSVKVLPFSEREASRFHRLLYESANLVRGRASLGDGLMAAHLLTIPGAAFATRNWRDFDHFDLLLVEEFGR